MEIHGRELGHFTQFVGLEASNLGVQAENGFQHLLSIVLLLVATFFQDLHRISYVSVKVSKDIAGLCAVLCRGGRLTFNKGAQVLNAAMLLTCFVVSVALVAHQVTVGAVIL